MIPRAACNCCGGGCCQCWRGEDWSGGGCCYGPGSRVRLTIPRPGTPGSLFGGESFACFDDCFGGSTLYRTYCCGSISVEPAEEMWAEYEWTDPCIVVEVLENDPMMPDPDPVLIPPFGPGWQPPYKLPGTVRGGYGPDVYCHVAHVFVLVELSATAQAWGAAGGNLDCIFPIEWWYVCAGCKKFPAMADCPIPTDYRPLSDQPCGYILPDGSDLFLPAKPAIGWVFVCHPIGAADCPFCIGACMTGDTVICESFTADGQQIFSGGFPANCGVFACQTEPTPCCVTLDQIDPTCATTISLDLTRCDGGIICCHRRAWVRESCEVSDGFVCVDRGTSITRLERVNPRPCVWDDDPYARCRRRMLSDPVEELDIREECPP